MAAFHGRAGAVRLILALALAQAGLGRAAHAADTAIHRYSESAAAVRAFWTPARMAQALGLSTTGPAATQAPDAVGEAATSAGGHYTAYRVFPADRGDAALPELYPFRLVGKLFWRDSRTGTMGTCTASVLRQRIIVTAGQCVAHGDSNLSKAYFFDRLMFIPGFHARSLDDLNTPRHPFNIWIGDYADVTGSFYGSGDPYANSVKNIGLVHVIEAIDRDNPNPRRIGDVVGVEGFTLGPGILFDKDTTTIGYVNILDGGMILYEMHALVGQAFDEFHSTVPSPLGDPAYDPTPATQATGGAPVFNDFGIVPGIAAGSCPCNLTDAGSVQLLGVVTRNARGGSYVNALDGTEFSAAYQTICGPAGSGNCE